MRAVTSLEDNNGTVSGLIRGQYHPHIDGLRAFAILSVLLYHAFPAICPGGFIGVDVFFVISGYLITKGLLSDLDKGEYSIAAFYVRRIRRILPAYLAVILFSLGIGLVLFYGEKLFLLTSAARASAFFITNIYFDSTSGYFAPAAHENALLNLWSLSVEEQFYIFFPLLLAFFHKRTPRHLKLLIWIVSLISLFINIYSTHFTAQATTAFFWLPFRAWELMAGSLLALYVRDNFLKSGIGLLALIVLLSSFFLISDSAPFPGVIALIPIGCAVVLLLCGGSGPIKRIMESRSLVFVGKISYSLYLFHWPLLVFCRYGLHGYLSSTVINLTAIFLSFVISILSWRYIELPVRKSKWKPSRYFYLAFVIIAITLVSTYIVRKVSAWEMLNKKVHVEQYWDGHAPSAQHYPDPNWPQSENRTPHSLMLLGTEQNIQYVLWGDSHAMALAPGFHAFSAATGINGLYINRKHTLLENTYSDAYPDNAAWIEQILSWLKTRQEIKTVVLVNRWAVRSQGWANESGRNITYKRLDGQTGTAAEVFGKGITGVCRRLRNMGKNVVIISSVPEQGISVPEILNRFALFRFNHSVTGVSFKEYEERQKEASAVFQKLEKSGLARIVWVTSAFFHQGNPQPLLLPGQTCMYVDDDHLSPSGAIHLLNHIQSPLKAAIIPPCE
ncbi:MAG: acyltransferase [Akkermansia sp.]|nr:acyltransferase [Akkermansia sp.]